MKENIGKFKEIIIKNKSTIMVVILILISLVSIILQNVKDKKEISINGESITTNSNDNKIAVYISGEVKNPGVYYIDENLRLNDLIKECGGLTEYADLSDINLAEKLNDSDKIDIPKIESEQEENEEEMNNEVDNDLININKATKEELKTLNGIGDTLAGNIIKYRQNNKFESIEDILNVDGIGQSKYNSIKEYICVN